MHDKNHDFGRIKLLKKFLVSYFEKNQHIGVLYYAKLRSII